MQYKVICEISFPSLGMILDVKLPINKSIDYICKMLDQLIVENITKTYQIKNNSILVNKRTGVVYDRNKLLKDTDIGNGTKLTYY